jgi:hypothetical protein
MTVNKSATLFLMLCLSGSAFATEAPAIIQVSQPGDSQMNCDEISNEISTMDLVINDAESSKSANELAGIGASVAGHFAGFFGGGVGAAVATNGANAVVSKNKQSAEERKQAAQQRRTMLMGMHTGKGCNAP